MLASTTPLDGMGKKVGAPNPAAMLPAGAKPLGGLNCSFCLTGKLNAYSLSGKGMIVVPNPARRTVFSSKR